MPVLLVWGLRDRVFQPPFLEQWRELFPAARVVVFGHSHIPLHEEAEGFQIFNPGSPTERRRAPWHSLLELEVRESRIRPELIRLS